MSGPCFPKASAFTVAALMPLERLAAVWLAVNESLAAGDDFAEFVARLWQAPLVEKIDPREPPT